jgi:hypothetical protein
MTGPAGVTGATGPEGATGVTGPAGATGAGYSAGDSINGGLFSATGPVTAATTLIRFKRGTAANLTSVNPFLELGEPCFEYDTAKLTIGDGVNNWNALPYL